jgi:transcriptional regulator with XRE-family HTH domain
MAVKERPLNVGTERARLIAAELGREIRRARVDRGLSVAATARAAGMSGPTGSRIERGEARSVSVLQLARLMAVVGLELSCRAFPVGEPIRDAAHVALLGRFRSKLAGGVRWATEVPLPLPGDRRAWDALIGGQGWRYGVEAETGPRDAQALARRLNLKVRDGEVDGMILVLPRSPRSRAFLEAADVSIRSSFPVDGARALDRLGAGLDPSGSAIVLV